MRPNGHRPRPEACQVQDRSLLRFRSRSVCRLVRLADRLIAVNLADAQSFRSLDSSIAGAGDIAWTVKVAGADGLERDQEAVVVFFAGVPADDENADYDTPQRLRGSADSWAFIRLVVAQLSSVEVGTDSMQLVVSNVAEEDFTALRYDPLDSILEFIGGYEAVNGLDENALRAVLEEAARAGAAFFPVRSNGAKADDVQPKPPAVPRSQGSPQKRYLFNRRDFSEVRTVSPASLAYQVFFQMWQNRQAPFNEIAEGDIVYIGDTETRRIYWEVCVGALLRDGYASTAEALEALWRSYGLAEEDLNDYHRSRPSEGVVLAWAPIVMQPLEVSLAAGQRFGQNGYRRLNDADLEAIGLPAPATGDPLAAPPGTYDPQNWRVRPPSQVSRYIPLHVRVAVEIRDRGTCAGGCGATTGLHFDHIVPFSRGGEPTVENIRLLCARSNLSKGSRGPDAPLACSSD